MYSPRQLTRVRLEHARSCVAFGILWLSASILVSLVRLGQREGEGYGWIVAEWECLLLLG